MSELVTVDHLSQEYGVSEETMTTWLKDAGVKASKITIGTSKIDVIDRDKSTEIINAKILQQKQEADRIAAEEAAREPTMKDVMVQLKSMGNDISDVAELQDEIKRLTTANQAIFKALTEFKTETKDALAGIKNLIVNLRDVFEQISKQAAYESDKEEDKKPRIAIVGISRTHHAKMHDELDEKCHLKLIDPSDIRGIHQLREGWKVFAAKKFIDNRHMDQMKSARITPILVDGSVPSILQEVSAAI